MIESKSFINIIKVCIIMLCILTLTITGKSQLFEFDYINNDFLDNYIMTEKYEYFLNN